MQQQKKVSSSTEFLHYHFVTFILLFPLNLQMDLLQLLLLSLLLALPFVMPLIWSHLGRKGDLPRGTRIRLGITVWVPCFCTFAMIQLGPEGKKEPRDSSQKSYHKIDHNPRLENLLLCPWSPEENMTSIYYSQTRCEHHISICLNTTTVTRGALLSKNMSWKLQK